MACLIQKGIRLVITRRGEGDASPLSSGYTPNIEKKEHQELNVLFKPVVAAQKIHKYADPKSVVYIFFMQEQCTKGEK